MRNLLRHTRIQNRKKKQKTDRKTKYNLQKTNKRIELRKKL